VAAGKLHKSQVGDLNANHPVIIIITNLANFTTNYMSVQKRSNAFGRVQRVQGMLNAELDHRCGSAHTPNVEPDHGPVHEKSGSNRGSEPNFRITNPFYWGVVILGSITPTSVPLVWSAFLLSLCPNSLSSC